MKQIGIIGYGALGRQILALLGGAQRGTDVVFFDDPYHTGQGEGGFPFESFMDSRFADHDFYIGLGYQHLQRKIEILRQLKQAGRRTPPMVHPSCYVAPGGRIGDGTVVFPRCTLDESVVLGEGVLLNNAVVISHDSLVGDSAYLAPGVVLSGNVRIGEATFLGTGVLVANQRRIGARARIGIGTVITRNVPDETSFIGNPQRPVTHPLKLE